MEKNKDSIEDLKKIRQFMKEKKISLKGLSIQMEYSTWHVIKVFKGRLPSSERFRRTLLHALQTLLQKDLQDFYKLMRGKTWITFTWGSFPSKELF